MPPMDNGTWQLAGYLAGGMLGVVLVLRLLTLLIRRIRLQAQRRRRPYPKARRPAKAHPVDAPRRYPTAEEMLQDLERNAAPAEDSADDQEDDEDSDVEADVEADGEVSIEADVQADVDADIEASIEAHVQADIQASIESSGKVDERVERLEQLLAKADQTIRELQELKASQPAPVAPAAEPVPLRPGMQPVNLGPQMAALRLAQQGLDPVEIARRLMMNVGEVELILNLRRSGEPQPSEN